MAVDGSGNIWFTETAVNAIGEIGPIDRRDHPDALDRGQLAPHGDRLGQYRTGILDDRAGLEPDRQLTTRPRPARAIAPITIPDPVGVLVDPATGYLWITEGSADKIVEYSPINEHILYTYNTTGSPSNLIWGPDGNIWFTEAGGATGGLVGILTPGTGVV